MNEILASSGQIRRLQVAHYPELLHLVESLAKGPGFSWDAQKIQEELTFSEAWGFWQGQALIAFVLWRENPEAFEIMILATSPLSRRQGAMKTLLSHIIAGCQKAVWLEVHEFNTSAIKLYQDLGFQPSGVRKNYYSDGASARLMSFLRKDF